jgi:KDO2-lipid IV(A) lauroyltransferase
MATDRWVKMFVPWCRPAIGLASLLGKRYPKNGRRISGVFPDPMSGSKQSPPKRLQWQLECLGHSIIERFAGLLPGPWVFRFGEALGGLLWHFMPQRRGIILRNLRIACAGELDAAEIQRLARASFRRSGANLISAAYTARLTPEKLAKVIHIENLELLEKSLATGKGVVLLLAHMGNWEILSRIVHLFPPGSKTGAFYRPLNNELLDARILQRRQADGTRMFSKRDPFHQVTAFLRDGGIVGILADQRVGMQGEVVPFFGRLTRASPLPSLLARRAKAEVLALSLTTAAPGRWRARFLPVEMPSTIGNCMITLEASMKRGLEDVFWLQERWKVYAGAHGTFTQWLDGTSGLSQKRHRALLWLMDAPPNWQIPSGWIHPDLNYEAVLPPDLEPPAWLPEQTRIVRTGDGTPALEKIRALDESEAVPYDFILTAEASHSLLGAARQLAIPVISLP